MPFMYSAKASARLFASMPQRCVAVLPWHNIMTFSKICLSRYQRVNALQDANNFIPLEHLTTLFTLVSLYTLQKPWMEKYSPALQVLNIDNKITVFTHNSVVKKISEHLNYVSFRKFSNWENLAVQPKGDMVKMMLAFTQLSMIANCNILTICFGFLITKSMGTHQMTFGGERVIGWALQEGEINLDHKDIVNLGVVDLKSLSDLSAAVECVRNGKPLPSCVTHEMLGANDENRFHVWLTFVTESGRIFDLDLSALQFGAYPGPEPVLRAESTAFSGMFNRETLVGVDSAEGFATAIKSMQYTAINSCSTYANGQLICDFAQLEENSMKHYMAVVDHILALVPTEIPKIAADKQKYFVKFICNTPCGGPRPDTASKQK